MTKQGIDEILEAVRQVLTVGDADICEANFALLEAAIRHGLVEESDCNLG